MDTQQVLDFYHEMVKRMVLDYLEDSFDCYLPSGRKSVRDITVTDFENIVLVDFEVFTVCLSPDRPDNYLVLKGRADVSLHGNVYLQDVKKEFMDRWPESEVLVNV